MWIWWSRVKTYAAVRSIPMVTTAVPKRPPVGVPSSSTRPVVRPSQKAVIVVPVIARIGRAVDSNSILTLLGMIDWIDCFASWDWVNRNLALKACSTGIEYRHRQHRVASLSTSSMDSRLPDHHLDQYLSLLADPLNPRLYNKKCVLLPFFGCWPRHVVKVIPACGNLGAISSAVWRWGTSLLHMIGQHLAK